MHFITLRDCIFIANRQKPGISAAQGKIFSNIEVSIPQNDRSAQRWCKCDGTTSWCITNDLAQGTFPLVLKICNNCGDEIRGDNVGGRYYYGKEQSTKDDY